MLAKLIGLSLLVVCIAGFLVVRSKIGQLKVTNWVIRLLSEMNCVDAKPLRRSTPVTSADVYNVTLAAMSHFKIGVMSVRNVDDIRTIGDLADLIEGHLRQSGKLPHLLGGSKSKGSGS